MASKAGYKAANVSAYADDLANKMAKEIVTKHSGITRGSKTSAKKVFSTLSKMQRVGQVSKAISKSRLAKIAAKAVGLPLSAALILATDLAKPASAYTVKVWAKEKGPGASQRTLRKKAIREAMK